MSIKQYGLVSGK